jgi:2-polyprenyl-3-methyl-5-hydroxy-6-metoxy-1,4-benzoquinol methylase
MKYFFKLLRIILNAKEWPMVMPELDLRYRIPRGDIKKMRCLNIGVGSGYSLLARQLPFFNFKHLTLCDVHEPYLKNAQARTWNAKTMEYVLCDGREIDVSGYDIVFAFDVLEHMTKEDAFALVKKIKCPMVVFGPLELEYRANVYEVKSQDHLSLWTEKDFINLGFKTEVLKNFHREDDRIFDAIWAIKN